MDPATLSKLLSTDGWALLSALPPYDEATAMQLGEQLRRRGLDPDLVAAAMTQSRLRAKAQGKLGDFASGMLFTPQGLEQASRLVVAAQHAQRYRAAGARRVADLTCGIGADAMAMAALGLGVLAVDIDELTAAIATVNLRHFPEVEVRHGDAMTTDLGGVDALFADPARRTRSGARRHDPSAYSPPLEAVLDLRDRVPELGVKIGPGVPHAALPPDAEAQWVSVDGDVVEAGLWFGRLTERAGLRTAMVLRGEDHHLVLPDGLGSVPPGPLGAYLYEPDGAVIRAGLVATVARQLGAHPVDPTIAYLTGPDQHATALAAGYRVLDHLPFNLKKLRAYLRGHDVGPVTIKKRGTAVTPEQLRAQLALTGSRHATLVLTRLAGAQTVIVVEPL